MTDTPRLAKITAIRDAVFRRAKGRCEACGDPLRNRAHLDHWLGGSGRRRQLESVETCWALCLRCDQDRTDNAPDAEHWNDIFRAHCAKHGYPFTPHLV